ncbi:Bug family tripartite tricarboxylate transporter substrate binding protein [Chloroflexota bacterium]
MNAPGGGFDTYSRAIARSMTKYLPDGVNIIVKNIPAAGGRTATNQLYRSKTDGYTVGLCDMEKMVANDLVLKPDYDISQFTWIGQIGRSINAMAVSSASPWTNIDDIIAASQQKQLLVPVNAPSPPDFLPLQTLGIDFRFILGFEASPNAIASVIAGESDLAGYPVASLLPWVESGDLRPIYVLDSVPSPEFINAGFDVPTISELGYPELSVLGGPRLVALPPNTPQEILAYWENLLLTTLADPELVAWSIEMDRPLLPGDAAYAKNAVDGTFEIYGKYADTIEQYYED